MNGMPRGAFNLPPGVSLRDIDPPQTCKRCDAFLHSQAESELCDDCEAEVAQEENE